MPETDVKKFDENFPTWVYAVGGLAVCGIAYQTGTRTGAMIIVLVLLVMVSNAYKKGAIK